MHKIGADITDKVLFVDISNLCIVCDFPCYKLITSTILCSEPEGGINFAVKSYSGFWGSSLYNYQMEK